MDPIAVAIIGWAAAWWLWGRPQRVAEHRPTPPESCRSFVIIPARNEDQVLPLLLDDLAADLDDQRQVIVVDDHSRDQTAACARDRVGTTVIAAPTLPIGWTGKSWACDVGVQAARDIGATRDDTMVFLDADVRLAPGALAAAAERHRELGGIYSVQPFHTTVRADEQLSLFPQLVSLMATGVGRRSSPPDGVFGPLLATSLADYDAVGGHAAVRSEVTEDVALGQRYRDAQQPVTVELGGDLIQFRMYPKGLGQLIEGWTKNMAVGAGAVPLLRTLAVFVWILAAGSAVMSLPYIPGNSGVPPLVGLALYGAFVVQIAVFGRAVGTFGARIALIYPVPLVAFIALFARSAWRLYIRRSVTWRDRTIPLGGARPAA